MESKAQGQNTSGLKYLAPMLETFFEKLEVDYVQNRLIPDAFIPASGKEVTITPLLYWAALDAYFINLKRQYFPAAEIQVPRGHGKLGLLDLALISDNSATLIEVKSSKRQVLTKSTDTCYKNINKKLVEAQAQLRAIPNDFKVSNFDKRKIKDVSIVFASIVLNTDTASSENNQKLEQYLQELMTRFKHDKCMVVPFIPSRPVKINTVQKKQGKVSLIGVLCVVKRSDTI